MMSPHSGKRPATAFKIPQTIRGARAIVVVTGAGVSAESGVPTFRGAGGLWRNFRAEDLATPEAFARDPRTVWEWYDARRQALAAVKPNAAHQALARLEQEHAGPFLLVTQNVDGLHGRAGSRKLVEVHGNIWQVRCLACGRERYEYANPLTELPPRCPACGGRERPGVVWFGEALPAVALEAAFGAARACDLMLVVGTSAVVYPVAYLPRVARENGARVIEINPEETPLTPLADESIRGLAAEVLPDMLRI